MKKITKLLLLPLALPTVALAEGGSPWLPIPGQWAITGSYTHQSGDSAYVGTQELDITAITGGAASKFQRSTKNVRLSFGYSDSLAFDLQMGYGEVKVGAADKDDGLTDTILGLNWRVMDEYEDANLPTVTLRAAAIIDGGYDGARLAALGNATNGFELAVLVGKQLMSGWTVQAELGVQNRGDGVPNATIFEAATSYQIAPRWATSLGYAIKRYSGNLDIGGGGFTPQRFQQVKTERDQLKMGVSYSLAGNQAIGLTYGKVIDGRNTVKDDSIVTVAFTHAF